MIAARRRSFRLEELEELSEASSLVRAFRAGHPDSHPRSSNQRAGDNASRNKQTISEKVVYIDTNIIVVVRELLRACKLEIVGHAIFSQLTPLHRQMPPHEYRPSLLKKCEEIYPAWNDLIQRPLP